MGKTKGGVIGFYHLHLLLASVVGIAACIIEVSFARKVESLYFWRVYDTNIFAMSIGLTAFFVAYFFVWTKLLGRDWARLKELKAGAGWYVWMSFISLGALICFLIAYLITLVAMYDLPTFRPISTVWLFLIHAGYYILLPVALIVWKRVRNK